jgi:hypothetical protein
MNAVLNEPGLAMGNGRRYQSVIKEFTTDRFKIK